ncbi:MAG: RNA polymerase subunit sigma-70 [Rhizobiales bacterium 65-9]|nr:RNA polymerase subunit sigma-70 [Hyphomicrobiales bacterium]OJY33834.1 MAG: RNA polymerase subunit sigma-70 [Rhizobiales bacterium 65-9]
MTADSDARAVAEAVARRSYGKLVAFLSARSRNVAAAEDALADAFARALTEWPLRGAPDRPEAWLMTVAKRRLIDASRRKRTADDAVEHLRLLADEAGGDAEAIPDERLALMFACAHPAIDPGVRAPLILQTVLGFDAATIASAFLVAPATMGQRLSRAKAKIRHAGVPFRIPDRNEAPERLEATLDAIYAAFSEGWTDPAGADARRRNLAGEAIWLGRLVMSLAPEEPEALGLVALMLHAEARRGARRDRAGEFVPLAEQDPALWNDAMIAEAETLLAKASRMAGAVGRYQLEAAVQSAHAIRRRAGTADWRAIAAIYDALVAMTGSPVVAINRAVAISHRDGASEGLAALDELVLDARLAEYQPYWAARADLAARTGDSAEASAAYRRAIGLEPDPAVRRFLLRREAALHRHGAD